MTQGDRVKELRKTLDLTLEKFGNKLGVTKVAISNIEKGNRNLTDQMLKSICREFNVNEVWLRTGEGEMFKPKPNDELEQLAEKNNLPNSAYVLIEKFLNLKPESQNAVFDFFKDVISALDESDPHAPATPKGSNSNISDDMIMKSLRDNLSKTPEELESKFPTMNSDDSEAG